LHAFSFAFAEKPVIHEYRCELVAYCPVDECRCHGGIHSATEPQKHAAIANLFADFLDARFDKALGAPVCFAPGNVHQEVPDDIGSVLGVIHFWVELDTNESAVPHRSDWRISAPRKDVEAVWQLTNVIAVAHP